MNVNFYKSAKCRLLNKRWFVAFPSDTDGGVPKDFNHLRELFLVRENVDVTSDSQYLGIKSVDELLNSIQEKGYYIFSI